MSEPEFRDVLSSLIAAEEPQKVILTHNGGSSAVVSRLAEELRKAFPTCDVLEIENPPPCVKCGLPAVMQTHGGEDLCGQCGDVKVESVVRVVNYDGFKITGDFLKERNAHYGVPSIGLAAMIGDTPEDPKYASRYNRRHAEPGTRFDPVCEPIRNAG